MVNSPGTVLNTPHRDRRNIGIIAHIDAGKTTVSERFLLYAGVTREPGEVHDGRAQLDWMDLERERGITITSAATTFTWRETGVTLIDTPGHVDFTAEVERSLRVLDGAIGVFCAVAGVQSQSESVWRQADKFRIPRLVYINKIDRDGADFYSVIDEIASRLHPGILPLQMPVGSGKEFRGVVDLISQRFFVWEGEFGEDIRSSELSSEYKRKAFEKRRNLIERLADHDDGVAESFLADEEIGQEVLTSVIRRLTIEGRLVPAFCGSALKNMAVQPLIDGIIDFLPSPEESVTEQAGMKNGEPISVNVACDPEKTLLAFVFKVQQDKFLDRLAYIRVYSGSLHTGDVVTAVSAGKQEKILRIVRMHADRRSNLKAATAGDIVAVSGLKYSVTGETLCGAEPCVQFEPLRFASPVASVVIEPAGKIDEDRLRHGVSRLCEEDPSVTISEDEESGNLVLQGMGELHLDVLYQRLVREYGVKARVGQPQVAYRESVSESACGEALIDREHMGSRQYAHLRLAIFPGERDSGVVLLRQANGPKHLPEPLIQAVEEGVRSTAEAGPLSGYPVMDIRVEIADADYREGVSDEIAFRIAAAMALKNGLAQAKPIVLEPVMRLEIVTPEEYLGAIVSNAAKKTGRIESVEDRQGGKVVQAYVPLRLLFGYSSELRSISQGRAGLTIQFSRYERFAGN